MESKADVWDEKYAAALEQAIKKVQSVGVSSQDDLLRKAQKHYTRCRDAANFYSRVKGALKENNVSKANDLLLQISDSNLQDEVSFIHSCRSSYIYISISKYIFFFFCNILKDLFTELFFLFLLFVFLTSF